MVGAVESESPGLADAKYSGHLSVKGVFRDLEIIVLLIADSGARIINPPAPVASVLQTS